MLAYEIVFRCQTPYHHYNLRENQRIFNERCVFMLFSQL